MTFAFITHQYNGSAYHVAPLQ